MNGAESLLRTAAAAGIELCLANPGTTEMPLVVALDQVPAIKAVLGLFEGVCTGAADGYGRMKERPALTLLHLGPGFANGIANLHNARRARSPIVNIIGDHATWHLAADAPLTSDIVSLAQPVSAWLRTNQAPTALAADTRAAITAALTLPGQIATLIVPHNHQYAPAEVPVAAVAASPAPTVDEQAVQQAATLLKQQQPAALYLGGLALRERSLRAAGRIAAATGCQLIGETFPPRIERGAGFPPVTRLPYFPEQGINLLKQFQSIILVGVKEPVSFFGYEGIPSRLIAPEQKTAVLAAPADDTAATLEALAESLGAAVGTETETPVARPGRPSGPLSLENLAAAVAAVQPADAIIVDEGNTSTMHYFATAAGAPHHTYLTVPGGAIGGGLPLATGAALACPERQVINLEADGSAMYTFQALWTQAREGLNVVTLICSNRRYRVLGIELARAGLSEPGPQARSLIDLAPPPLDWVRLAGGLGVPGVRVETAEALVTELERALAESGPRLIEVVL